MTRLQRVLASCSVATLAAACSPAGLVNALTSRDGYTITRDVAYGEGARRTLDIYRPQSSAAAPVVVFIYGGSWQEGSKGTYLFAGQALAARGFLTVIPDYRVYPEVRYPDFLQDCAAAVRWTRDHAASYGGDPGRLFLVGHSAGAYNAAMLALDGRWLGAVGMDPKRDLEGVVGLAGPYDFLPLHDDTLKIIFGTVPDLADTQPITHVSPGAPPMLLAAGTADKTVDPGNVMRLAARLRAAGDPVDTHMYQGLDHIELVGSLAWPLRFLAPVLKDTTDFLHAHDRATALPLPAAAE